MKKLILLCLLLTASAFAQLSSSGTLSAANAGCPSIAACLIQPLYNSVNGGTGSATITLAGGFSATVQFEATNDASYATASPSATANWFSLAAVPITGGASVTSATAAGTWSFNVGGLTGLRVRASAFASGPLTVTIQTSLAVFPVTSTNVITGAFADAAGTPFYTPGVTNDMCQAIANAAVSVGAVKIGTAVIDARGFRGTQICTAEYLAEEWLHAQRSEHWIGIDEYRCTLFARWQVCRDLSS